MSALFLSEPSPSGDYEEHRFEAKGDCSWVLFRPPNEADWVGIFGKAKWGKSVAAVHWGDERAFVIAGGRGYLINTATRDLLYRSEDDRLQDVIYVEARRRFVVADGLYLHVLNLDRLLWSTARVSWDGIRRLAAVGPVVSGEAWTPSATGDGWSRFTCDLDSRHIVGATYNGPDAAYRDAAT